MTAPAARGADSPSPSDAVQSAAVICQRWPP